MPVEDRSSRRWTAHLDEERFVRAHLPVARSIALLYFIPGSDRDDVLQEAMVGLMVAARCYDGSGSSARFAALVVHGRLQTCLRAALRMKHRPLTEAARVGVNDDGAECDIVDLIPAADAVEDVVERRDDLRQLGAAMRTLSRLERDRLLFIVNGGHYPQGVDRDKRLENAVDRARRKLRAAA